MEFGCEVGESIWEERERGREEEIVEGRERGRTCERPGYEGRGVKKGGEGEKEVTE